MKVLGICAFPEEFACTRYRLLQYIEPLKKHGIELEVRPFLDSKEYSEFYEDGNVFLRAKTLIKPILSRIYDIKKARNCDLVLVQREAMLFGPAIFERLYRIIGQKPLILDLDDAVYLPYLSPKYGRIGTFLKFFGKTDFLIKQAKVVICGGRFLAEHVEKLGTPSEIIPTVVDSNQFFPVRKNNDPLIIGWIGTGSTFPFLESIFPVLQKLAKKYDFVLRIRGSEREKVEVKGVKIENLPWQLETEVADFQSFDIGLYPLKINGEASLEWIQGKSGFKAIQYYSLGLPFVMSPIGVCQEMGISGETHFLAENENDWEEKLSLLLENSCLRKKMGEAGRKLALEQYNLEKQTEKLAQIIKAIVLEHKRG